MTLQAWIDQIVSGISPVSETRRSIALKRLDTLTKPLGSLGQLEEIAAQWVAVRGDRWREPLCKGAFVFAADHGVTAEGVSAYPQEVTRQMVLNFVAGGAAVNVLARAQNASLTVIDVGVAGDLDSVEGLVRSKVANGTRNMRREPAMSENEVYRALEAGASMASLASEAGQSVVAIGEMGIGNTTAASAIACALTGADPHAVTGRGTGVGDAMYQHKVEIVRETVAHHFGPSLPAHPAEVLRCIGGLEIAAMTGMILQASRFGMIVVIDGFIATAAALVATKFAPACRGYLIAGHSSSERGHAVLLEHLKLRPLLNLNMRLGEASGAILAMPIIEAAVALYGQMATFESAGVSEASA
jgi:nicotinate-nucleotide--dimethylbenzimidazole phosphoribosyltransferase